MKLDKATDKEIYQMRERMKLLNILFDSKIFSRMEKELDEEYKQRGIVPALAWDFERRRG